MSKFIKLGPCPHCGSKDNRAEYTNGYWCFGCSKYEPKDDTPPDASKPGGRGNQGRSPRGGGGGGNRSQGSGSGKSNSDFRKKQKQGSGGGGNRNSNSSGANRSGGGKKKMF